MPAVRAFRAVRYANGKSVSKLLCPPYDIIPEVERTRYRREPFNAIHLELPETYETAKRIWDQWLSDGVLRRDERPFLYIAEQALGAQRRFGVFVDLSLDRNASRIVAHERTFSKPKADRLELLKALGANTSPIFGIVDDPGGKLLKEFRKAAKTPPIAEGRDPAGGRVRLWAVPEPRPLIRAMAGRPMLIADGHHRFGTSADYAQALGRDVGCLTYIASEADPGLLLLPTHRVVTPGEPLLEKIRAACTLTPLASRAALDKALLYKGRGVRLGLYHKGKRWLAVPRKKSPLLPVEWLAGVLDLEASQVAYPHRSAEAEAVARRDGGLAVLLPAPSVKDVRTAVAARGLLPQKSTYFFPKVPTGLVFRELN